MSKVLDPTIDAIRFLIREELGPSDQLPTEQELVTRMGVSRATIREAISLLAADGVVEKKWGVGTFVSEPPSPTAFGILSIRPGIPGVLATTGGEVSLYRFRVETRPSNPELFPDFPAAPTFSLLRVFALDGVPTIAVRDLIVAEIDGKSIDIDSLRSVDVLVYDVLKEAGVEFDKLDLDMRAADLDEEGQSLFDLSETEPVIRTQGFGCDTRGRAFLFVRATYRTQIVNLRVTAS